jgi:hypothetical protein
MIAYIICESHSDIQILQAILPKQLLKEVEFVAAGGISSVTSLARSIVVRRQVPVAIVVDADSTVPELVQMQTNSIKEIVESVSVSTPVKVILFVPEMEAIFFQDTQLLAKLLGYIPSQDELTLAISQPKKILNQLIDKSKKINDLAQFITNLSDEDINNLRNTSVIQELIYFLWAVREPVEV